MIWINIYKRDIYEFLELLNKFAEGEITSKQIRKLSKIVLEVKKSDYLVEILNILNLTFSELEKIKVLINIYCEILINKDLLKKNEILIEVNRIANKMNRYENIKKYFESLEHEKIQIGKVIGYYINENNLVITIWLSQENSDKMEYSITVEYDEILKNMKVEKGDILQITTINGNVSDIRMKQKMGHAILIDEIPSIFTQIITEINTYEEKNITLSNKMRVSIFNDFQEVIVAINNLGIIEKMSQASKTTLENLSNKLNEFIRITLFEERNIIRIDTEYNEFKNYQDELMNLTTNKFKEIATKVKELQNLKIIIEEIIKSLGYEIKYKLRALQKVNDRVISVNYIKKKKISIKAHIRHGVKMSQGKIANIKEILQDYNLQLDALNTVLTIENFEEFNWRNMTIVDGFEKEILKKETVESEWIDKSLSKELKLEKANKIHRRLVDNIAYTIEENKFRASYSKFIDLVGEGEEYTFVFEMKSINSTNEYSQVLKAFSQLSFYPTIHSFSNRVLKVLVLNEKLSDIRLINFLKKNDINICWQESGVFVTYSWGSTELSELLKNQVITY